LTSIDVNGCEHAHLMIDCQVGVRNVDTFTIKKIDLDYFETED
jgi:restriction endonuclease Mrr